ncbi:MAG: nitrogen regulation protein NR(I), partial [Gammaproteobacteria bacterium]|nr:nitrogen regulation protein NR(I) [Gammaproteobacteria bacterium]
REPSTSQDATHVGWEDALKQWAEGRLNQGEQALLDTATPTFERIMIETAMQRAGGHRQDAAKLLGWGRNTLTRKIKELGMEGRFVS